MKKQNKIYSFILATLIFALGSGVSACGSSSAGGSPAPADDTNTNGIYQNSVSGKITLQFENESIVQTSMSSLRSNARSNASSSSGASPTFFGMKLIAAYLAEDIDPDTQSNLGQTLMFYLNEDCEEDIMHCDISGGTAEDNNPIDHIIGVDNYFDLTNPADVNEQLNQQTRDVIAGTFQYVRMEFCKLNSEGADNVEWSYDGVALRSFALSMCTVTSAKITPPIEISDTSTAATFIASYDPVGSISTGPEAVGNDCTTDTEGTKVCFTVPTFVPSVFQQ